MRDDYRAVKSSMTRMEWLQWVDAACKRIVGGKATTTDVAHECGATESTVRRWVQRWREENNG